jgi:hypothetical protein
MDAVAAIISTVVVMAHRLPREQRTALGYHFLHEVSEPDPRRIKMDQSFWPLFFGLDGRLGGALRR